MLYGRINIVKTLVGLSKLIYSASVLAIPDHYIQEINKITFNFMRVSAASPRGRPPGNPRATQGLGRGFVAKACPTRGALERFCVFGKIPRGHTHGIYIYVTNLVFSLETIVLLYFVTTNKLDESLLYSHNLFTRGKPFKYKRHRFSRYLLFIFQIFYI